MSRVVVVAVAVLVAVVGCGGADPAVEDARYLAELSETMMIYDEQPMIDIGRSVCKAAESGNSRANLHAAASGLAWTAPEVEDIIDAANLAYCPGQVIV